MSVEDTKLGLAAARGALEETGAESMLAFFHTPVGSMVPGFLRAANTAIEGVVGTLRNTLDATGEFQITSGQNNTAAKEAQQIVNATAVEEGQEPHELIRQALGNLTSMADRADLAKGMYELVQENLVRVVDHLGAAQALLATTITFAETGDQTLASSVDASTHAIANLHNYEAQL